MKNGNIREFLDVHGVPVSGLLLLKQIAETCQSCDPDIGATIRGAALYDVLEWQRAYLNVIEAEATVDLGDDG